MAVIAEGIESFEETRLRATTKIRYAQGFYFSRPIFLEELKPAVRILGDTRVSSASRPLPETRPVYARGSAIAVDSDRAITALAAAGAPHRLNEPRRIRNLAGLSGTLRMRKPSLPPKMTTVCKPIRWTRRKTLQRPMCFNLPRNSDI
jgi:hypothetical protein